MSLGKDFVKEVRKLNSCKLQNNDKDMCRSCFFYEMENFSSDKKDYLLWLFYLGYRGCSVSKEDKVELKECMSMCFECEEQKKHTTIVENGMIKDKYEVALAKSNEKITELENELQDLIKDNPEIKDVDDIIAAAQSD